MIKNRKIWEEDNRQNTEKLGIRRSLLEALASEQFYYSDQLRIRQKILPIEAEISRLTLERSLHGLGITEDQKEEYRNALKQLNIMKKINLERAEWRKKGISGGLKIASEDIKEVADTFAADATARLAASLPYQVSNVMASSFIGLIQGRTPDLQAVGISMAESVVQTLLEGILNQVIPALLSGLAEGLGSILGGLGGGGGGGILGGLLSFLPFHRGGLVTAHSGYLAYDERIIKVQTGERVLSRQETREYDSGGRNSWNGGNTNVNIYPRYPMSRQETEHLVRTKLIPAMIKQQKRMGKYR